MMNDQRNGMYVELTDEQLALLPIRHLSAAENAEHVLRCLISYHERVTMADIDAPDCYLGALRYSLFLVEKELEKQRKEKQQEEA